MKPVIRLRNKISNFTPVQLQSWFIFKSPTAGPSPAQVKKRILRLRDYLCSADG